MVDRSPPVAPERRAPARSRVVAMVTVWLLVMVATCLASGCYGRNCQGITTSYGRVPGEGRLLDADTWESSPVDGQWLDFSQQRIWFFDISALGDRTPDLIIPYVSAESAPFPEQGNFVIGAGNIAEISSATKGSVVLKNGTCADYYLRLVVKTSPRPPNAPNASTPAPVLSSPEAGADAGAEGGN